jgi:serine/threonine-protein kinase
VWVYDVNRAVPTRLTFGEGDDDTPVWSPDGEYIFFASTGGGGVPNLFRKRSDGSGEVERLTDSKLVQYPSSVSPDGKLLAFHEADPENDNELLVLPLEGEHKPEPFLSTPFSELESEFSPDGRWIAYESNESGAYEIYVRPFPKGSGKWQISTGGGRYARWSPAGKELFYRTSDGVMAVSVDTSGSSFRADKPRRLYQGPFVRHPAAADYDVAPDGKRFVMFRSDDAEEESKHTHLTFVSNWFEELRRTFAAQD